MVFSSRTWKALCSFQSAETAVMSPELRTGRCPSLQPLRAIKSRVPTSVTGEFPGSRRQGCVAALRRGGNAVTRGLREKNHTNMKPHQTLNTFIYPTCLLGIWVWRKYYGPRLFLGSKSCLCWDNILLSVGSITKLPGDLVQVEGLWHKGMVCLLCWTSRRRRQGEVEGRKWCRLRFLPQASYQYFPRIECSLCGDFYGNQWRGWALPPGWMGQTSLVYWTQWHGDNGKLKTKGLAAWSDPREGYKPLQTLQLGFWLHFTIALKNPSEIWNTVVVDKTLPFQSLKENILKSIYEDAFF